MLNTRKNTLGSIIRQRRVTVPLTLQELSALSGVSPSHLGRIERGNRYPSASILRKIARHLGFEEDELFTLAGYLTPHSGIAEDRAVYHGGQVDPYVSRVLSQEPVEVQRATISILTILKTMARNLGQPSSSNYGG